MAVTNKEIHERGGQLFAHGPSFQMPGTFANRIDSSKVLHDYLNSSTTQDIPIISDLLGSGKSFLVDVVTGRKYPDERITALSIRKLRTEVPGDYGDLPLIILDEVDIKTPYRLIKMKLELIKEFLRANPDKRFLLVGDYTLRNEEKVLSILPSETKFKYVDLEELNKKFFIEALVPRIHLYICGANVADPEEYTKHKETCDKEPDFFEEEFLDFLLPNTEPVVATFREVLTTCSDIYREVPIDTKKCEISGIEYEFWLKKQARGRLDQSQENFLSWLYDFINAEYKLNKLSNKPMKAMSTSFFRDRCPLGIKTDEEYERKILRPFTARGEQAGLLKSFGIPYSKDTSADGRTPGPYLPTIRCFLEARYGEGGS